MEKTLAPFGPYAYAILRTVAGFLLVSHGGAETLWLVRRPTSSARFAVWSRRIIELVLGLLIAIGLLTHYAAFIASGKMAVAYFIGHFPKSFWPLDNGGEPAVLFCHIFICHDARFGNLEYRCGARRLKFSLTQSQAKYRYFNDAKPPGQRRAASRTRYSSTRLRSNREKGNLKIEIAK